MKKSDLLKLLENSAEDAEINSIIMENAEFKPKIIEPPIALPAEPPKEPVIKSDTPVTVTAAELAKLFKEMNSQQVTKKEPEEDNDNAEIYL